METKDCCEKSKECCEGGNTYIVNIHNGGGCCCHCGGATPNPGPEEKPDPGPEEKPDPEPTEPGGALDPEEVYKETRPNDWLPMPEPKDDEMYLLFHIPHRYSAIVAFAVTCELTFTVEAGTVINGTFVSNGSLSKELATGKIYENELLANDFGNLTSTNMKQCMLKVSGKGIQKWLPAIHTKKEWPLSWNIVEICAKLPAVKQIRCCIEKQDMSLKMLRFFTLRGTNALTNTNYMFSRCHALTVIRELDTANVTSTANTFYDNYLLTAIPKQHMEKVRDVNLMFVACASLTALPVLNMPNAVNTDNMLISCGALSSVRLDPEAKTFAGGGFSVYGTGMNREAIIALFQSLPMITGDRAVTVRDTLGAADLSEEDMAIARGKGWKVVL